MLSRLRPLDFTVNFEDRPYGLGETVNLTLQLSPKSGIDVREGRVDLVCEMRYTEVVRVVKRGGGINPGAKRSGHGFFSVPRQVKTRQWYRGQSLSWQGERWRSGDTHGAGLERGRRPFFLPPELQQEVRKHRVAYVHSSVVFVRDERIRSDRTTTYSASLDIGPDPPSYGSEGRVTWSLVTTVDVVRARNGKARRLVNVI